MIDHDPMHPAFYPIRITLLDKLLHSEYVEKYTDDGLGVPVAGLKRVKRLWSAVTLRGTCPSNSAAGRGLTFRK